MKITVRQRQYPDGRKVWTADIHVQPAGERAPERFRITAPAQVTSKSGAERWANDQARRIAAEGRPYHTRKARAERQAAAVAKERERVPTLREWWAVHVESLTLEGRKPSGLDAKLSVWKCWLEPQFGDLDLRKCCSELEIQALRARLAKAGRSPGYTNNVLAHLLGCLRHAARVHEHLGLKPPPVKRLRLDDEGEIVCYPPESVAAILAECDERDRARILLMLDAGLRAGEVLALRWTDVGSVYLNVRGTVYKPKGRPVQVVTPKSGKGRAIPLTSRVREALERLERRGAWLFPSDDGLPQAVDGLGYVVEQLCERAGVEHLGLHAFRHTFATEALQAGTDLETVRKYLGHANIKTTQRYLHSGDREARAGIAALEEMRERRDAAVTTSSRARVRVVKT